MTEEERKARQWLEVLLDDLHGDAAKHASTILQLLDRPAMLRGWEVPDKVLGEMVKAFRSSSMIDAVDVLYDYLAPAPKMTLREALHSAIADIQWMSAASDFSPSGQAHVGWIGVRDRLNDYEAALKKLEDVIPESKKFECWGVVFEDGQRITGVNEKYARDTARLYPGSRVVKLVETDDE